MQHVRDIKADARKRLTFASPSAHEATPTAPRLGYATENPSVGCNVSQELNHNQVAPEIGAMAAGVSQTLWSMGNIVALIDAAASTPKRRGPYKSAWRPK